MKHVRVANNTHRECMTYDVVTYDGENRFQCAFRKVGPTTNPGQGKLLMKLILKQTSDFE